MTAGDGREVGGVSFRRARDADWAAMAEIANAEWRARGVDQVTTAEGLAADHPGVDMARDVLIAEAGGVPVGYCVGRVAERDGALVALLGGAVHPGHQRRGIGTALLRRTRDQAVAAMAADPRPLPRELWSFALDAETASIALLAAEGFTPIRYGFEMRRTLGGELPAHRLPPGIELRPALEADYRAIWEADEEAFRDHWGHRAEGDDEFRAACYGPNVTPRLWCVAWDGDRVAGVVMNVIFREENEALGIARGWLDRVSVRRPWRGRGLARALCSEALRVLRDEGMAEAWLGVDGSNPTGALWLYEGLGFGVAKCWKAYGRPADRPAPAGWRSASDRATIGA